MKVLTKHSSIKKTKSNYLWVYSEARTFNMNERYTGGPVAPIDEEGVKPDTDSEANKMQVMSLMNDMSPEDVKEVHDAIHGDGSAGEGDPAQTTII